MKYAKFIAEAGLNSENFRWAFAFGSEDNNGKIENPKIADELAGAVLSGRKTATASAFLEYSEDEPLPSVDGKFDIVLNGSGEPVAAITTSKVTIAKFNEVTVEHAYKEGEGDLSLDYWREVHEKFWQRFDLFSSDMDVVCEEFEVLYKKEV